MLAFLHASTAFLALFFYPIHHIGFVHLQYFPYAPSADSSVVHFDRQLPGLFRVFMPFRVYGVIDAALLTFAALAPRSVIPRLDLVLYLSAFWASFPCLFCALSHIFYYTIKSLFWTLPQLRGAYVGVPLFSYARRQEKAAADDRNGKNTENWTTGAGKRAASLDGGPPPGGLFLPDKKRIKNRAVLVKNAAIQRGQP